MRKSLLIQLYLAKVVVCTFLRFFFKFSLTCFHFKFLFFCFFFSNSCLKVEDQGVDPNLRDGDGATPLHFAASRGHLSCVRWLLNHGAKLSLDKYGKSPINDAAENQQVEVFCLTQQPYSCEVIKCKTKIQIYFLSA